MRIILYWEPEEKKNPLKNLLKINLQNQLCTECRGRDRWLLLEKYIKEKKKQQNLNNRTMKKKGGLNVAWIFNWLQQAMETNRKDHTCFSCVFHPSLVRRFVVKAIKLQRFKLLSNMGLMVYDVYGRLVRPSALLAGSNPVLGTVVTC